MFKPFRKKGKNSNTRQNGSNSAANQAPQQNTYNHDGLTLLTVSTLKDVPANERPSLFVKQLALCQQTFNYNDPSSFLREKEKKRLILLSLVDYVNGTKEVFSESVYPDIIAMVSANLFRDLPPKEEKAVEPEDEEPMLEPAWPHMQIVYEFLLRFIVSTDVDAKIAKKYISQSFIIKLLQLFNSEDPRERDYLKTILHRIYGKFMALRAFIRRAINNVFYSVMYDNDRHNGIGELLEILGSIINGFALPLKAEHKRFLIRGLIPLHKVRNVGIFHQQLAYCVTQFVEKDPKMAEPIILGLLRFWPNTNSPKQCLFLNELEDVLELIQPAEFEKVMVPLFKRIALCLDSPHFQVAERTLFLWNNEYLVSLVAQNRHVILPMLIGALEHNATKHWNPTVTSLTQNVLKLFVEMDKDFYNACNEEALVKMKTVREMHDKRNQRWSKLAQSVH